MSTVLVQKTHDIISRTQTHDNELMVGSTAISVLAAVVGTSPFYVYDKQAIIERIKSIKKAFPDDLKIHYAIKANPMPAVVHSIAPYVDGFDLASHKEMLTALSTDIPAAKISIAGPGKSANELQAAIAAGIVINVESSNEMKRIVDHCASCPSRSVHVALRVNPSFNVKGSGMVMGGAPTQFGIDVDQIAEVIKLANDQVKITGLHIYSGSQNLNHQSLCDIFDATFALAKQVVDDHCLDIKHFNMGGGLGVPYFVDDKSLDLAILAANLKRNIDAWKLAFPQAEVIMELGRYVVAEAGYYVCKVIEKKYSKGMAFLVTDGGLHHHLAATGNFGQIIRRNYPISVANRMQATEYEEVSVVGPLCTPLDTLGKKVMLPKADVGDLIAIHQSGAYGLSASPNGFLSHPMAGEFLI